MGYNPWAHKESDMTEHTLIKSILIIFIKIVDLQCVSFRLLAQ